MSWMDSWSRPSANSKVPAPFYLTGDVPYCRTCGRVMSTKKSAKKQSNDEVKYCSDRCRSRKPGALDRRIEKTIVSLLNAEEGSGIEQTSAKAKAVKGDPRIIVTCDEIETIVFGSRFDPEKVYGRRKNRKARALVPSNGEWKSVDMESEDENGDDEAEASDAEHTDGSASVDGGVRIRPPQDQSETNFSAGGGERGRHEKLEESMDDLEKRRQGAKRAEEREMVRRAARRVIVFGAEVPRREPYSASSKGSKPSKGKAKREIQDEGVETKGDDEGMEIRKAEALMSGQAVEPSFAKGNWSIRWRD